MTGAGLAGITTVVVPTLACGPLHRLLAALALQQPRLDACVLMVDDRPGGPDDHVPIAPAAAEGLDFRVVRTGGGGPAYARNLGWRLARTPWLTFLDDNVVPCSGWTSALVDDLARAEATPGCVGTQGRIVVPLPADRRPADGEHSSLIPADLTCRRTALAALGGFDERFSGAVRADADLALRLGADRGTVLDGTRRTTRPVRRMDALASLRQQAGKADDVLMTALHDRDWYRRTHAPAGRRAWHAGVVAAAGTALVSVATGRRRTAGVAAGAWAAGTAELARAQIVLGPRDASEVVRMLVASAAIPFAATWHSARGAMTHRRATPWRGLPDLVLLDRDGTLVHDVPCNGDPALVRPVDRAGESLARLRARGVKIGLVTNQSAVACGLIDLDYVHAVHDRLGELVGPFDTVQVCPHGPGDGCACRTPAPGLVERACVELGVEAARTVVIGDIGADVEAAAAAGAVGILVPDRRTRAEEVAAAHVTAPSLPAAVDMVLTGAW